MRSRVQPVKGWSSRWSSACWLVSSGVANRQFHKYHDDLDELCRNRNVERSRPNAEGIGMDHAHWHMRQSKILLQ